LNDHNFQPSGGFKTEVELAFTNSTNPFHETFDHEEVVIDRYTSSTSDALANRPLVRGAESHEFAALLAAAGSSDRKPSMAIVPATWPGGVPTNTPRPTSSESPAPANAPPGSMVMPANPNTAINDDDLIVIEESSEKSKVMKKPAARVRRQEYRQLFAQLRRG
jgi:hypothetical protein